jgi:UDP-N-acetylmuramoyl-L-alanyl-D-glutamate--2,6-diaminopimelate ligase
LTNAEVSVGGFTLGSGVRAKLKISLDQSSAVELELQSSLLGEFNLSNLLSVAAYAIAKGYDVGALKALSQIEAVAGRMERFMAASGTQLVVDYAHTPAALENVLATLSQLVEGKLSVVFGCGGDRDKGKRPLMAEVAERYADQVIVTDDNPRTEDPEQIVEDIIKGFSSEYHYQLCRDRKQAISQAFCSAQEKDIILVAGKGHEDYQEVNGHRHYFSDAEVCRELIALPRRSQDELFA